MIYDASNVPTGTKAFVNGNEIDGSARVKCGQDGWVEFYPKPYRAHKTRKDEIYCRKLKGRVHLITPDGAIIYQ